MRIPANVATDVDDFIRFLALMPQHRQNYRDDPEWVIGYSKLSSEAADCLRDNGVDTVLAAAAAKWGEICDDPKSWTRSNFNRDRSVGGYGGTVIKKGK